jgi:putative ATP-dependent endonuclease of the OLD family
MELSTRHQVVVTSHNPIFTNRDDVHQNVIVNKNRAYAASSVKEIRKVLGVRLDDNLSSAEVVVVVEGEEDRIAIKGILASLDSVVAQELKSGRIGIDVLGGASNLSHRVRLHSEALCQVHAFLDDDAAARQAFAKARADGILDTGSVNFTTVGGKNDAELEDLYDENVYQNILKSETGFEMLNLGPNSTKKWTERLRNLLRRAGKPLDDGTILAIKVKVAQAAAAMGISGVHQSKRGPIESLCNSLKDRLQSE